MRTTLTLDDDVAATLRRLAKRRGESFKETVNMALRCGLDVLATRRTPTEPYRVTAWNLGGSLAGSLDNVEEVLSRVEGEAHR
ncbi:MAG: CopG family transcriptional regulator [Vicinamibacterales bacterium]